MAVISHKNQSLYSRINFTKSLDAGAGNVNETRIMLQVGRVGELLCE
jgi:hypothetical protein